MLKFSSQNEKLNFGKDFFTITEFKPMSKSCPSLASWSNAWHTGFELLKWIDFIGSYTQQETSDEANPKFLY